MAVAATGGFLGRHCKFAARPLHYTGLLSLKSLKSKEAVNCDEDLWLAEKLAIQK